MKKYLLFISMLCFCVCCNAYTPLENDSFNQPNQPVRGGQNIYQTQNANADVHFNPNVNGRVHILSKPGDTIFCTEYINSYTTKDAIDHFMTFDLSTLVNSSIGLTIEFKIDNDVVALNQILDATGINMQFTKEQLKKYILKPGSNHSATLAFRLDANSKDIAVPITCNIIPDDVIPFPKPEKIATPF